MSQLSHFTEVNKYFDRRLPAEQQTQLKEKISTDLQLQKQAMTIMEHRNLIQTACKANWKTELLQSLHSASPKKKLPWFKIMTGLAFLFIAIGAILFLGSHKNTNQLSKAEPQILFTNYVNFNEDKISSSIKLGQLAAIHCPASCQLQKAILAMEKNEIAQANQYLSLIDLNNASYPKAHWYKCLILLKSKNAAECKLCFQKHVLEYGFKRNEALDIIKQL